MVDGPKPGSLLGSVEIEEGEEVDRKASTTSSLHVGNSTIANPNVKSIIQAVATILQSQMLEVCLIYIINIFIRMRDLENKYWLLVICSSSLRKNI